LTTWGQDFRSDNGLYSLIQEQLDAANKRNASEAGDGDELSVVNDRAEPPLPKRRRESKASPGYGRDLFDHSIWRDPFRTSVFCTFASTLRQKSRDAKPTPSHHFISHLRDCGKLVRCYTQNIDQIEEKVGLSTSLEQGPGSRRRFSRKSTSDGKDSARGVKVNNGGVECVLLQGSLQSLRCIRCGRVCEWDKEGRHLETMSGLQPNCPHCAGETAARQEKGKRALGVGKLRPDIVLYGEEHPKAHLIGPLIEHDLGLYPNFMLILGTSLKVHGLKVIVREFAKAVHSKGGKVVFVNFTMVPQSVWGDIIDYWIS
jgi:NAD-dependent SIR2 family protein deacetylase